MISDKQILLEIHQLPENTKQEVLHYIGFLKMQNASKPVKLVAQKRQFGSAKGKYKLSPDFDLPLEDFDEYMS